MSGIVGHTMYALLAQRELMRRECRLGRILNDNQSVYLNAAYLGCDIQTLPEAVCVDTGREVGYGTVPLSVSPLTGGPVKPWKLQHPHGQFTPREIHQRFYGRTHLVFGWYAADRKYTLPYDHLPDYVALVARDALSQSNDRFASLAWVFGWLVHIVGDSLIKSIQPGLSMKLLDGLYTPANRPVQDLFTWHQVGIQELQLDWEPLLDDVCRAPLQPIQLQAMRVTRPGGHLASDFSEGWVPADESLAAEVCRQNRRYLPVYLSTLLPRYQLRMQDGELHCHPELSSIAGGLTWLEMLDAARAADMRGTLQTITELTIEMMQAVCQRVPSLKSAV